MRKKIGKPPLTSIAFCALFFHSAAPAQAFESLGGIPSPYSTSLTEALPLLHPKLGVADLTLECYDTPGNRFYIGARQEMRVDAPLAAVRSALDDVARYAELFDGMVKSELREKTANRFVLFSEQEIPLPFVPNERSEVLYAVDADGPPTTRVVYRYQLRKSNHLKADDGAIVLESLGEKKTAYLELDFWDADWGLAKALAPSKLWRDNIAGLVQSDLAIKLRAEHPDWATHRVLEDSKKAVPDNRVSACVEARTPSPFALASPAQKSEVR